MSQTIDTETIEPAATPETGPKPMPTPEPTPGPKNWRGLLFIASVALALAIAYVNGWANFLSFDALVRFANDGQKLVLAHPMLASLAFVSIYILASGFALPGAIWLTIGSGLLFGAIWGAALSAIGATLGSLLLYALISFGLAPTLAAKAGPWLEKLSAKFGQNAFGNVLALRLVPVAPFFMVNLVGAILRVPLGPYTAATLLGVLPAGYIYASLGAGLKSSILSGQRPDLGVIFEPRLLVPLCLLALLSLMPTIISAIKQARQS